MRLFPALVLLLGSGLLVSCDTAGDNPDDGRTVITLLAAYTPGARAATADIEAHVRQAIDETNVLYENSAVDLRLVPVHLVEVNYEVDDRLDALAHLIRTDDGVLDELHTLRDEHEADVVVLVSATPGSTINGAVMAEARTAFVIVVWDGLGAPGYGLAHEVGHLQGARHEFEGDPNLEPFPYGHGFKNDSLRTLMTGGPEEEVPFFSGPDQVYEGVVLGDSARRDVARVLRETAVYVSNFRGPQTPTDFVPPSLWPRLPDL